MQQDRLSEPSLSPPDDPPANPPFEQPSFDGPFAAISEPARHSRRLPERILVAVHQACDIGALEIAQSLLGVMNDVVRQTSPTSPAANRRAIEGMVAAHHRLWHLRQGLETPASPENPSS